MVKNFSKGYSTAASVQPTLCNEKGVRFKDLSPYIPLSTQTGGRLPMKWRGVHPEGDKGGEVKKRLKILS